MNKRLSFYIKLFHHLTFSIENEFKNIYDYDDRLTHFKEVYQKNVLALREKFVLEYLEDEKLKAAYHDYMNEQFDYILFVNLNISAPDQRKFDGGGYIPFTVYWYQVVIWEIYQNFTMSYYKSRDMGLSFAISAGETMMLFHKEGRESIFLSRVEADVDKPGDRTQTLMGKIRQMAESTAIYTMENFHDDKNLHIYSNESTGITGKSTSGHPGRSNRARNAFADEAGAQKTLAQVKQAVSMTAAFVCYAGTLMIGTDTAFRVIIKEGFTITPREIFNEFHGYMKEGFLYREAWDKTIETLKTKIPKGKAVSFMNSFEDHPLKAGNTNYFEIESNRLLNDPIVIAHELKPDLNAESPDRSFYNITREHLQENLFSKFNLKQAKIYCGFDPGSVKKAFLQPIVVVGRRHYVLPTEQFNEPDMFIWARKMLEKYPRMVLFPEMSVMSYSKANSGWMMVWRKAGLPNNRIIVIPNRDITDQILVVNHIATLKSFNMESYEEESELIIDKKNEWWVLHYINGAKYSDMEQQRISHPAEAFISGIFGLNRDILESVRGEYSTA